MRHVGTGLALVALLVSSVEARAQGAGFALRFYGNGANDIDRVKIRVDDPATATPGPPVDVGATDFTLELWMKASAAENTAGAVTCGANILVDRDRYNQPRAFGVSIAGGRMVFGVLGDGTGARTICGTRDVRDGQWHHVAVQRRRADGWLELFVDGVLEAGADGPDGDVSYPDDGVPGPYCGGPCTNSDPFLVLGAEKHDAGAAYPAFAGWVDELRVSNTLRYQGAFTRPAGPFVPDVATVALYHFDDGAGDAVADASMAVGGPSTGVRRFGGNPGGPAWVVSDAPLGGPPPPTSAPLAVTLTKSSFTAAETLMLTVNAVGGIVATPVDAYVVVLAGGSYLSLQLDGRLVPGLVPIARRIVLPTISAPFGFPLAGAPPGAYQWLAALTTPGTLTLTVPLVSTPFAITP